MLLIGGGGYCRIGIGKELMPTARWPAVVAFGDGQRALRLLRARAAGPGVDPARIGVVGFPAEANVAGVLVTCFTDRLYTQGDAVGQQSDRPEFASLIYPLISSQATYDTTRSWRQLDAQSDAVQAYSVDRCFWIGRTCWPRR